VKQVRKLIESGLDRKGGPAIALVAMALGIVGCLVAFAKAGDALAAEGNHADLTGGNGGADPLGWIVLFGSATLAFILLALALAMISAVLIRRDRLQPCAAQLGRFGSADPAILPCPASQPGGLR
jgi:hypothetical protein